MAKVSKNIVFKSSQQNQISMLPPSLDELIDAHHPVRLVNAVVDKLDLTKLLATYKGGGTSSYHPGMLLKVLIYGYITNTYFSRKLEAAIKENIHFMWLAGMQKPDHNTINRFRGKRLAPYIKQVFTQVVKLLIGEGVLDLKAVYTDGTFMESRANRYTFVWAKNTDRHKGNLVKNIQQVWNYAQSVTDKEAGQATSAPDFSKISPDKIEEVIDEIDRRLDQAGDDPKTQKVKKKVKQLKKQAPQRLARYNQQERILDGRNSYSKTDPDATFMRTKQDRMGKGEPRPGYNVQLSTIDQFIVLYSTHQTASDTVTFPAHMHELNQQYGRLPEAVVGDAGYGSEENYTWLDGQNVDAYLKYSEFYREQKGSAAWLRKSEFAPANLHYNADRDCYYCPMGQAMHKVGEHQQTTKNGFTQTIHTYQAQNCRGCPLRGRCHKQA